MEGGRREAIRGAGRGSLRFLEARREARTRSLGRECGPANTLIGDFRPQNRKTVFQLLWATGSGKPVPAALGKRPIDFIGSITRGR